MKSKKKQSQAHKQPSSSSWIISGLEQFPPDTLLLVSIHSNDRSRAKVTELAHQTANLLKKLGVVQNNIVAIDAELSRETLMIWLACSIIGAVPVFFPSDMRFRDKRSELEKDLLNHDNLVLFVGNPENAKIWIDGSGLPLQHIISIKAQSDDGQSMDALFGWPLPPCLTDYENALDKTTVSTELQPVTVSDSSPAFYFYSQGSRQHARRVSMSYQHLHEQVNYLCHLFSFNKDSKIYIDLKSHHAVNLILFASCVLSGSSMIIGTRECIDDIQHSSPTHIFMLPHHLQSIKDMITNPPSASASRKRLRNVSLTLAKLRNKSPLHLFKWSSPVVKKLCIDPIISEFFPKTKAVISYGNHFDGKLAEFFLYLNIPIYNAFTVSEVGFVHIHEFMSSGGYLPSVDTQIKNGILSVRPHAHKGTFISTQDYIIEDDRLGLCSHRNDDVTLQDNIHVDTSPMHDILTRHPLIDEVFIFGNDRPFLTALIYINRNELTQWAETNHLSASSFEALTQNQVLYEHILSMVTACNQTRGSKESIQKIAILNRTIDEDPYILTACRLTRRIEVKNRYALIIKSFYENNF